MTELYVNIILCTAGAVSTVFVIYYRKTNLSIRNFNKVKRMELKIIETKNFALIGYPLGHSISPFIHSKLEEISDIYATYECIEIKPENLKNTFDERLKNLDGFNVTIPHKINIIPCLDELSDRAKIFGAVNTVKISGEKASGYNTDCIGFTRSLGTAGMDLNGKVLILGCGGVARVFAYESVIAGGDTTLAIRKSSLKKALALKDEIKEKFNKDIKITYLDEASGYYHIIINGTPVGMFPNVDASPIDENLVKNADFVFDAIYNPEETKLIKFAKKNDIPCLNGLPMLVWQAAAAQEIWNDIEFSNDDVQKVIELSKEYLKNE